MSDRLELSRAALFQDGSGHGAAFAFLSEAVGRRQQVTLTLGDDGGTLLRGDPGPDPSPSVTGRWRGAEFDPSAATEPGARLLLPLLFRIAGIRLAADDLATLGRRERPVADVFARSLFFVCLRRGTIRWQAEGTAPPASAREFQHRYFFLLKAYLPDPLFADRSAADGLDLVLASLYLEDVAVKNPLLRLGAQTLRRHGKAVALRRAFDRARAEVLEQVAP